MSNAASIHLARASKAARLLKEATSQEEAALLLDAGMSELNAALVKAPKAIAERVQQMVNEISKQMLSVVNEDMLVEAFESAQTAR
jgi:sugar-specific transcriptional regulator TrmB